MRVFQNPFEAGKCFPGAVVAIGKFDALHVGHKKVIGAAVKKAKSPQAFAKDILTAQIKPRCVFVGEDFCFGRDRAGRVQTLEELGPKLGFSVHSCWGESSRLRSFA